MNRHELSAIAHELNFWKSFVQTKRFLDGWVADIPTPELRSQVHLFIKQHLPKAGRVLDVGSGVVSILNGTVPKKDLVAVDPLGELYQLIFDYKKFGVEPPLARACEDLSLGPVFDIVHISNALDHTQDPVKAHERLLACVKPGGYLIVQSFENEALHENWQGFHQFNLSIQDSFIAVESKAGSFSRLSCGVETVISVERIPVNNKIWFIHTAQKA